MSRVAYLAVLVLAAAPALAQQRVFSTSGLSYCIESTAGAGSGSTFMSQRVNRFDITSATEAVGVGLFAPTFFIPPNIFDTWAFIPLPLNATAQSGGPNGASLSTADAANYAGPEGVLIARRGGAYCLNWQGFAGAQCGTAYSECTTTVRYRVIDPYGCLPNGTPVVVRYSVELRSVAAINALGRRGATTDSTIISWVCQSNSSPLIQGQKHYDAQTGWIRNDPAPVGLWQYTANTSINGTLITNYMRVVATANATSDGASLLPDEPDYAEFNLVLAMELKEASITDPAGNPMPWLALVDTLGNTVVPADDPGCTLADLACPFGVLDASDIDAFIGHFLGMEEEGDLNGDGIFDLVDIDLFGASFRAACPG